MDEDFLKFVTFCLDGYNWPYILVFKDLKIASCFVVDAGQRLMEVLSVLDTALKSCLFIAFVFHRSLRPMIL